MPVATTPTDTRPLKIQLFERLAKLVESGSLDDLEAARSTYEHPVFRSVLHFDPDEAFTSLEEMRAKLDQLEQADPGKLGTEMVKLQKAHEALESQARIIQQKITANRARRDEIENALGQRRMFGDNITNHFRLNPLLFWMPSITDRLKAMGFRIPPSGH